MPLRYLPIWILAVIVLCCGMFFPKLMDTDAPEYAGVAMHMYETGNWLEIINRGYSTGAPFDYLEKPHMIYWSALPGYLIFGVHDYAYRLISVLLTIIAAWATGRVGKLLYNNGVGAAAAILFISSQAILLANHDVRTDSLLTSFCILAIAQCVHYIFRQKKRYLVYAGAFLACAIAAKGMIAVLVCGCVVICYLAGRRDWKTLFNRKWVILCITCFVCLLPVLYCYYLQFDLHPEKLVNGKYGVSGVKHLLWSQSFDRFSGTGDFTRESPEFIFFFHTLLWAFLPWSLLAYGGLCARLWELWRTRGVSFFSREQLSFAGVWVMFVLMSFSKIKLPHYINVLFPMMSVFVAGYLYQLLEEGKEKQLKAYRKLQQVLAGLLITGAVVLNAWAFPIRHYSIVIVLLLLGIALVVYYRQLKPATFERAWLPSAMVALLLNFLLNTNFYPQLGQYQAGSAMAGKIAAKQYDKSAIYLYGYVCRSFDFYMRQWSPMLDDKRILDKERNGETVLLFVDQANLDRLAASFRFTILETVPDFHITALDIAFLNPATRSTSYSNAYLVKVLSPE
jgi:4-amino-4-deoxy-L-arabinose transferase-like glycosyltransferase